MLINFLFLIITILILIFQKINLQDDKYLVSRNNIEIEKKNELCNIVKYTSTFNFFIIDFLRLNSN